MTPILTTVTPVWNRPKMFNLWKQGMESATIPEVNHLVVVADNTDPVPESNSKFGYIKAVPKGVHSLGKYHNLAANCLETKWIMKFDLDAIPSVDFFKNLIPVIEEAKEREWFNCGMFFLNIRASAKYLESDRLPVTQAIREEIVRRIRIYGWKSEIPDASNFICRREDYLSFGGCDKRFSGYGWEDYQQTYMLERRFKKSDPLPGELTFQNVAGRCKSEICRRKARMLFDKDNSLCLFHRWHGIKKDGVYKSREGMQANRKVLFDCINEARNRAY